MKLNASFKLEMWTFLEGSMNKLLKILWPVCVCAIFTVGGHANADTLFGVDRARNLTELPKAFSLLKKLVARVSLGAKFLPKPVAGRNKYGYPVPDLVRTAHEDRRKSDVGR